jgi:hypothetical protein
MSVHRRDNDALPPMFRQGVGGSLRCDSIADFSFRRPTWHVGTAIQQGNGEETP